MIIVRSHREHYVNNKSINLHYMPLVFNPYLNNCYNQKLFWYFLKNDIHFEWHIFFTLRLFNTFESDGIDVQVEITEQTYENYFVVFLWHDHAIICCYCYQGIIFFQNKTCSFWCASKKLKRVKHDVFKSLWKNRKWKLEIKEIKCFHGFQLNQLNFLHS